MAGQTQEIQENDTQGWSPEQHRALVARINQELLADPATAGKVFAIDGSRIESGEMTVEDAVVDMIVMPGAADNNTHLNSNEAFQTLTEYVYAADHGTNIKPLGMAPSDDKYLAIATTAPVSETGNEALGLFSRAGEYGADFEGKVTTEFTQTFSLVHETVEAVRGDKATKGEHAVYADQEMNTLLENRTSDVAASLHWIKSGGDLDQLKVMANARDLRMGHAPENRDAEGRVMNNNISHDTGPAIREVIAKAEAGTLDMERLQNMSLSELTDYAETEFSKPSMPTPEKFAEMQAAADNIQNAQINFEDVAGPVSETEQEMLARFNHAHESVFGYPSHVNDFERYKAPEQSAMEQKGQSDTPAEQQGPGTYFAAWRTETAGYDPAQNGGVPFGTAVAPFVADGYSPDVAAGSTLTGNHHAVQQTDTTAAIGRTPPQPEQPGPSATVAAPTIDSPEI